MRTRSVRHLTAVTALALASMAAAAACSAAPVRPVAAQTPPAATPSATAPSTSVTPTPSPRTPKSPAATRRPPGPAQPQRCLGAVVYRIDASVAGPARSSVCITVGGVVRVNQLGPEGMTRSGNVSCYYEAAVHTCRLIRTGTVRFTINRDGRPRELTVVVAKASTPPKPSPACDGIERITFDASESGPPWPALCLKVGSVLRVENLGPGGLSANPSGLVSCNYAAGVHECRFVKPGTVTFTMTGSEVTVVAIK